MKKFLTALTAILLSLCLCVGVAACDNGGSNVTDNGGNVADDNGSGGVTDDGSDDNGSGDVTDDNGNDDDVTDDDDSTDDSGNDGDVTDDDDTTDDGGNDDDDTDEKTVYTVTFDSQGGSEVPAQSVLDGDYARQPSRPEREGYYFLHWSEEIGGERFVFTSRIITRDITLYAVWGTAYTVTFDTQGGSEIPAQYVSPNTSARNPDSPTKEGFHFLGWYTAPTGGAEWHWNDPVNGNITVYAHWEADTTTDTTASLEYTYDTDLNGYVVSGVGQETDIRIPAEYNGTRGLHPVVGIGDRAFRYKHITSVELPASLTSIGANAFTRTDLTSVTIPASVTTLGNYAFSECSSLTEVIFEEGSQLEAIGQRAFADDPALSELTIPASVTSIGNYLIRNSGVTTIHFLGTRSAWDAINKAENWNYGNTDVAVICADEEAASVFSDRKELA